MDGSIKRFTADDVERIAGELLVGVRDEHWVRSMPRQARRFTGDATLETQNATGESDGVVEAAINDVLRRLEVARPAAMCEPKPRATHEGVEEFDVAVPEMPITLSFRLVDRTLGVECWFYQH